jgi:anti-anti-sigma regulatory factor
VRNFRRRDPLGRNEFLTDIRGFPDCHNPAPCRAFLKEFTSFLSDKYRPRIIFDLSGVRTLNADGIDLLLKCVILISECDGELRLAGASAQTSLVLELTQLNQIVDVFPTVAEALATADMRFSGEQTAGLVKPAA